MAKNHEEDILTALRKITRAIDLYSHQLSRQYNLTGPQIVCLRHLRRNDGESPGEIARSMHLSQATITGILDRLEKRGLVERTRSREDRRRVFIALTDAGVDIASAAPSPLQETFARRLKTLPQENQAVIATILNQVVSMMEASDLEAAPVLQAGSILDGPTEPA